MTIDAIDHPARREGRALPLALRLSLRELRGGISGFSVFIACIALGVAVIAGVGALGDALRAAFETQGATLLGGDATLSRPHQRPAPAERAWLARLGSVSETATVRALARKPDGSDQTLVEVKGIDAAYPLVGGLTLSPAAGLDVIRSASTGALVEPIVLERLGLKIGDTLRLGRSTVAIRGIIEQEPDKIADRLTVGPRVMIPLDALLETGLADPGSLVTWKLAVRFDDAHTMPEAVTGFAARVRTELPEGGFSVRDRRDPAPNVTRTLERLRQFLTLLGLTALLVGGVGVANAVATWIDRRRNVIAAMRSLGATGGIILGTHLIQAMIIAGIGVAIGLALGTMVPPLVGSLLGGVLPVEARFTITASSLAVAALYGFLVALVFTLWPIGRAEQIRAAVLFRDEVAPASALPRRVIMVATVLAALALLALGVLSAEARLLAFYYCLAVIGILAAFTGLGWLVQLAARRIPRPRRPEIALALSNIAAPGGLARAVVLSLGAGLSLLVAVALVDRSIVNELQGRVPETSPNYFVLDVKRSEQPAFEQLVRRIEPNAQIYAAPMLRGRMIRIGDTPVEQVKARPEHQWVLNGDRGLSYAETIPDSSRVTDGQWWPADYDGPPLVSMEGDIAKGLGLKVGDTVTVNILGRNVTARIANLREVKWESLAINFVLVFSPNTLRGAPHNVLATVTLPKDASLEQEARVSREIAREFPAATAIRVKDAINQFNAIFTRIMTAVRAAGSITILAGALVLAGALATAQRRRIKQAVVLKVLGATRARIVAAHMIEYAFLAFATSLIAALLGAAAAWVTLRRVMELDLALSFPALVQALGLALLLVGLFGGIGTWRVLQARTVPQLRSD
ncbi:MAG: ABC transporter permease [Hyphomicrobiales bacterium]|nr:ABC transporter permease [Hyphomicrobiales bacterium]